MASAFIVCSANFLSLGRLDLGWLRRKVPARRVSSVGKGTVNVIKPGNSSGICNEGMALELMVDAAGGLTRLGCSLRRAEALIIRPVLLSMNLGD